MRSGARPSRGESSTLIQTSNLLLLPVHGGAALGAALAALTGLNPNIASTTAPGFNELPKMSWILTPVSLAAVALLVVRLRRGRPGPDLWVFLATLTAFCLVIGLSVGPDRPPTAARYVFPGAVISLLVVVEAARVVGSPAGSSWWGGDDPRSGYSSRREARSRA